jgi:hypothetical protein
MKRKILIQLPSPRTKKIPHLAQNYKKSKLIKTQNYKSPKQNHWPSPKQAAKIS